MDAVVFTGLEIEFYLFVDLESLIKSPFTFLYLFFHLPACLLAQFPHGRTRRVTPGPVIQYSGIMQHDCEVCL